MVEIHVARVTWVLRTKEGEDDDDEHDDEGDEDDDDADTGGGYLRRLSQPPAPSPLLFLQ